MVYDAEKIITYLYIKITLLLIPLYLFSKFVWIFIVVASLGVASLFIFTAGEEFVTKVVVTTIDTTTAPLQVTYGYSKFKLYHTAY